MRLPPSTTALRNPLSQDEQMEQLTSLWQRSKNFTITIVSVHFINKIISYPSNSHTIIFPWKLDHCSHNLWKVGRIPFSPRRAVATLVSEKFSASSVFGDSGYCLLLGDIEIQHPGEIQLRFRNSPETRHPPRRSLVQTHLFLFARKQLIWSCGCAADTFPKYLKRIESTWICGPALHVAILRRSKITRSL